ncbi:LEF-3 [Choristoneura rosaceana nucleopolyhedrovirus]|uniref:LEF-3 n=1 Tax=Choristoneura rosaceana nucleopolyhedrovirus TaxID=58094 RepID=S5N424_9ABAC|nr:LEF-3 [Choristoneura rosaceana nucleopolyhedrovirus]AGR57120.1 LEF-3 [Choristoneura rosaceana nucleopolyhedrovirus]
MAAKREYVNDCGGDPPRKRMKENYKRVTGKLLNKMTISLENHLYYTFTFRLLNDNKTEAYYGNLQCFKDLVEQECYDVSLNFVKTKCNERIEINEYVKCDTAIDDSVTVKQSLTRANFENEETVNVLAKLKCVFKRLAANNYKMVFEFNMRDAGGSVCVQQVECFASLKMLASAAKAHVKNFENCNELMDFYFKHADTLFYVHNVRCHYTSKGQNVFLNWTASPSTSLEKAINTDDEDYINLMYSRSINNISRANKHLKCLSLAQFKAEQKTNDNGKNSFTVQFKTVDSMEEDDNKWNKCVYYVDSNNNKEDPNDINAIQKLAMDFDQLATCLTDGLTKGAIFVTIDNADPNTMNMLGLLKYDEEEREYHFI